MKSIVPVGIYNETVGNVKYLELIPKWRVEPGNKTFIIRQMKQQCTGLIFIVFAMALLPYTPLHGQTTIVNDSPHVANTSVVIPGREFKRSGYHNFFWGRHYRKEWNTAIRVEHLYLDSIAGGLVPILAGGGRQTRTLRLRGADGREYVLRSVNKDFTRSVPETEGTFIARIVKDQSSMLHPYSSIMVTPLAEAAGIFHTVPRIVFVPAQPALDSLNRNWGNQLYIFEQRPDEDQSDAENFGYSKNVIGSEKLAEKIYGENDNDVDQLTFVRARLFDMFIGDWGRYIDNWRWAEFDMGSHTIYKPVPRDRDHAFSKIDGFYPRFAASIPGWKHLQGFGHTLRSIGGWNVSGRSLDQKFLNELSLEQWLQQARELQRVLTDSLIENSVRLMPPQMFTISGPEIIAKLKSRRGDLQKYARDYYKYLAKSVSVLGSEKTEKIEVNVLPERKVRVDVFKINKSGNIIDTPYYSRVYDGAETKEIFIYGLGQRDIISLKGEKKNSIGIRIIDPEDEDSIYMIGDRRQIKKIRFFTGEKFEYDTIRDERVDFSVLPVITPSAYKAFDFDPMDLFPKTGIKISAGVVYTHQPWRKSDYMITHSFHVLHGFLRKSLNAGYVGRFRRGLGAWDFLIKGRVDDPAVENYFGTGNRTEFVHKKEPNYYRTFSQRIYGGVGIERNFEKLHHAEVSLIYQAVKYRRKGGHYLGNGINIDPSVFNRKQFAGLEVGYRYDHTNGSICPSRGFTFQFGGGFLKNLADTGSAFAKMNAIAGFYLPLSRSFIFAVRAGGATLFGNPDFYHLNRLGGNVELRGYERERFYGKSIFYTNTELRWITNTKNYFFNGRIGLIGFYDIGRVWMPEEKSSRWHDGYGMGLAILPFNKITLMAMYGLSDEGDNLFFRAELFF